MYFLAIALKIILGLILFIIGIALFYPISYRFQCAYHQGLSLMGMVSGKPIYQVAYEYGMAEKRLSLSIFGIPYNTILTDDKETKAQDKKIKKQKQKQTKKENEEKEKAKSSSSVSPTVFFDKELILAALGLVIHIISEIKPKYLNIQGQYGFEEPHHTGYALALLQLVKATLPRSEVAVEPVWHEAYLDGEIKTGGRVVIAHIIWLVLKFLLHKKTRGIILLLIKSNSKSSKKNKVASV